MGKTIRVAGVQAAPVFLNKQGSIDKACALIQQAAAQGADLIGFPEGFIPTHPAWLELLPGGGDLALALYKELFLNAVDLSGPDLDPIKEACRAGKIICVLGFNEKRPHTTGTLYNSQVILGRDGEILNHHKKYVPTIGERLVHAPGQTGYRASAVTDIGGVSALICGENSNPLAQYAIGLDYPVVHVASWPQHFSPGLDMQEVLHVASRGLAYSLKCFVVNSVAVLDDDAIAAYGLDLQTRVFLDAAREKGGASILGPRGEVLAGPLPGGEGLLYADLDPEDLLIPKQVHDFAGHYNRPDLFAPLFGK